MDAARDSGFWEIVDGLAEEGVQAFIDHYPMIIQEMRNFLLSEYEQRYLVAISHFKDT